MMRYCESSAAEGTGTFSLNCFPPLGDPFICSLKPICTTNQTEGHKPNVLDQSIDWPSWTPSSKDDAGAISINDSELAATVIKGRAEKVPSAYASGKAGSNKNAYGTYTPSPISTYSLRSRGSPKPRTNAKAKARDRNAGLQSTLEDELLRVDEVVNLESVRRRLDFGLPLKEGKKGQGWEVDYISATRTKTGKGSPQLCGTKQMEAGDTNQVGGYCSMEEEYDYRTVLTETDYQKLPRRLTGFPLLQPAIGDLAYFKPRIATTNSNADAPRFKPEASVTSPLCKTILRKPVEKFNNRLSGSRVIRTDIPYTQNSNISELRPLPTPPTKDSQILKTSRRQIKSTVDCTDTNLCIGTKFQCFSPASRILEGGSVEYTARTTLGLCYRPSFESKPQKDNSEPQSKDTGAHIELESVGRQPSVNLLNNWCRAQRAIASGTGSITFRFGSVGDMETALASGEKRMGTKRVNELELGRSHSIKKEASTTIKTRLPRQDSPNVEQAKTMTPNEPSFLGIHLTSPSKISRDLDLENLRHSPLSRQRKADSITPKKADSINLTSQNAFKIGLQPSNPKATRVEMAPVSKGKARELTRQRFQRDQLLKSVATLDPEAKQLPKPPNLFSPTPSPATKNSTKASSTNHRSNVSEFSLSTANCRLQKAGSQSQQTNRQVQLKQTGQGEIVQESSSRNRIIADRIYAITVPRSTKFRAGSGASNDSSTKKSSFNPNGPFYPNRTCSDKHNYGVPPRVVPFDLNRSLVKPGLKLIKPAIGQMPSQLMVDSATGQIQISGLCTFIFRGTHPWAFYSLAKAQPFLRREYELCLLHPDPSLASDSQLADELQNDRIERTVIGLLAINTSTKQQYGQLSGWLCSSETAVMSGLLATVFGVNEGKGYLDKFGNEPRVIGKIVDLEPIGWTAEVYRSNTAASVPTALAYINRQNTTPFIRFGVHNYEKGDKSRAENIGVKSCIDGNDRPGSPVKRAIDMVKVAWDSAEKRGRNAKAELERRLAWNPQKEKTMFVNSSSLGLVGEMPMAEREFRGTVRWWVEYGYSEGKK